MSEQFSVITCSIDAAKFAQYEAMLRSCFSAPYELIHIADAKSLCEGYNRGARRANGDVFIFCHDDIAMLRVDFAERLTSALQKVDLVGVAGTSRLVGGKWVGAGFPYLHGHVCHGSPDQHSFSYVNYGCGKDPDFVDQLQALDGVFFAVKRQVWESLAFDEETYDGFHLYDLDFTFRAFLAGYRIAVDYGLHLLHFSSGQFDRRWNRYKYLFQKKFKGQLSEPDEKSLPFYRSLPLSTLDQCRESMAARNSSLRVGFDPDTVKPHFQFVRWENLELLESSVCFWEISEKTMRQVDNWEDWFYKMVELSSDAALIHWKGSAEALAEMEALVSTISKRAKSTIAKVASRSVPRGYLLLSVNKPIGEGGSK